MQYIRHNVRQSQSEQVHFNLFCTLLHINVIGLGLHTHTHTQSERTHTYKDTHRQRGHTHRHRNQTLQEDTHKRHCLAMDSSGSDGYL